MLHLCRNCFNAKMLTAPMPRKALDEPIAIVTKSEGVAVGVVEWQPYARLAVQHQKKDRG